MNRNSSENISNDEKICQAMKTNIRPSPKLHFHLKFTIPNRCMRNYFLKLFTMHIFAKIDCATQRNNGEYSYEIAPHCAWKYGCDSSNNFSQRDQTD